MPQSNPFIMNASQIAAALQPDLPPIPELEPFRAKPSALAQSPVTQQVLQTTADTLADAERIPLTRYSHYRYFLSNGDRLTYETPYWLKRRTLAGLALRLFMGETQWKPVLQDYLWAICEETNWVLPAHERGGDNDLFSAETAFMLASALHLLGDALDPEICARVRFEIEKRVFQPYLTHPNTYWWYKGYNNWNGVCNGSIACAFVLLENDPKRLAQALEIVFPGLDHFLNIAFEKDGTSTEGVGYWNYGLINFVSLAEMLCARTAGAINLYGDPRMSGIAAYPAKMLLSGSMFAAFSDADEIIHFHPGIVARLAQRTGESSLEDLLALPVDFPGDWRLAMMLRDLLWWDGKQKPTPTLGDAVLKGGGVARLVGKLDCCEKPVIAAIKAGHNAENHNQNDVGSFIIHVDGENLITDPGRGLYNRDYFNEHRYENIFANSFGHSVPRIGGSLQSQGLEFRGELLDVVTGAPEKRARIEFSHAYAQPDLTSLIRTLTLGQGGSLALEDNFTFKGSGLEVEEAFVTWFEVSLSGNRAVIHGERHALELTIEEPAQSTFQAERLEQACRDNHKPGVLKRITVTLPPAASTRLRLRMRINNA